MGLIVCRGFQCLTGCVKLRMLWTIQKCATSHLCTGLLLSVCQLKTGSAICAPRCHVNEKISVTYWTTDWCFLVSTTLCSLIGVKRSFKIRPCPFWTIQKIAVHNWQILIADTQNIGSWKFPLHSNSTALGFRDNSYHVLVFCSCRFSCVRWCTLEFPPPRSWHITTSSHWGQSHVPQGTLPLTTPLVTTFLLMTTPQLATPLQSLQHLCVVLPCSPHMYQVLCKAYGTFYLVFVVGKTTVISCIRGKCPEAIFVHK